MQMPDEIRLTLQVIVSLMIIFGVLWWMWRIPGEPVTASLAATTLSFVSVWLGVASVGVAMWLWWTSNPQSWAITSVLIWAAALSTGLLALWTYRHTPVDRMPEEVILQRFQARVGVGLGLLAVVLWYIFMIVRFSSLTFGPAGSAAERPCADIWGDRIAEIALSHPYHCSS